MFYAVRTVDGGQEYTATILIDISHVDDREFVPDEALNRAKKEVLEVVSELEREITAIDGLRLNPGRIVLEDFEEDAAPMWDFDNAVCHMEVIFFITTGGISTALQDAHNEVHAVLRKVGFRSL